jgi:hypothetical protein
MFVEISVIVLALMAVFLLYVAFQSSDYSISREIKINRTPEALFTYINNSKKMNEWMPWKDSDPKLQMQYSGPEEGVGAKSSWNSTGKMGTGEALIVESTPHKSVKSQLRNYKPFESTQLAEVLLEPVQDGTVVRWSVTGKNSFMGRLVCTFMNMDKMVGGAFEKGLTKFKSIAEGTKS